MMRGDRYSLCVRQAVIRQSFNVAIYALLALCLSALWPSAAKACSRLLWNTNGDQVVVGRTVDWSSPLKNTLYIVPRGLLASGGTSDNPMVWKVKYGSVVSAFPYQPVEKSAFPFDDNAVDGMNEKGFSAHALFLANSSYESRDPSRPGVSTMRWVQYLLDNFSTVKEALSEMDNIQIVPHDFYDHPMNFHVSIEDKTGDSGIIEYIDGTQTIHHGREFIVMTNDPTYDTQIKHLAQYRAFGGQEPLPGNIASTDRFARLQYFAKYLPQTKVREKAAASVLTAMRTVTSPFGAPYGNGKSFPTWSTSVADLKNGIYYYDWLEHPNIIQINLATIDFSEGTGVRWLDPRRPEISGIANGFFQPLAQPN